LLVISDKISCSLPWSSGFSDFFWSSAFHWCDLWVFCIWTVFGSFDVSLGSSGPED
ncbi:21324_t:CDS:1, partial [Gigaspora rosea]